MIEVLVGLLGAAVLWFIVDVIVGSVVGELLLRPMQIVLGPPIGKFVIVVLWLVVAVLAYLAWSHTESDWTDYWAWLSFFFAGLGSLLALIFYAEEKRMQDRRGSGA